MGREDLEHMWSTFAKREDGDIEYEEWNSEERLGCVICGLSGGMFVGEAPPPPPAPPSSTCSQQDLIQWILKPSTPLSVTALGELAFFDLKAALEPLFWVWLPDLALPALELLNLTCLTAVL